LVTSFTIKYFGDLFNRLVYCYSFIQLVGTLIVLNIIYTGGTCFNVRRVMDIVKNGLKQFKLKFVTKFST
jgi:hypothetical protein